jgi:prepilin-type N-terminal cleavage/methylation domain-containing protein
MSVARTKARQYGFTLIELLVALGIFLLVTGAAFTLLGTSQRRYQTETQVLTSFQEARLALDQIVRDVDDSGYPPPTYFNGTFSLSASSPFAWSSGAAYPNNPCQIATGGGGSCTTATAGDTSPGDFDLIIETNPNPLDPNCAPNCTVQWIRYQLLGTTLYRGTAQKQSGHDPDADTSAKLVPLVQNVINNSSLTQIAQYQLTYPTMFPAGAPVPIFTYICDHPSVPQSPPPPTTPCPLASGDNSPANIRDVVVTLIVSAPTPDATSGVPRIVQLSGRGRRVNPNQ